MNKKNIFLEEAREKTRDITRKTKKEKEEKEDFLRKKREKELARDADVIKREILFAASEGRSYVEFPLTSKEIKAFMFREDNELETILEDSFEGFRMTLLGENGKNYRPLFEPIYVRISWED